MGKAMINEKKDVVLLKDYATTEQQHALEAEAEFYEVIYKIDDRITRGEEVSNIDILTIRRRHDIMMCDFDYSLDANVLERARELIQRIYAAQDDHTKNRIIPTRKIVYLAGRISGLGKATAESNFWTSTTEAIELIGFNIDIINPMLKPPLFGIKTWLFYMIPCIWRVRKSDIVAMQPNWTLSKGAVIEYWFARFLFNKQIIFLSKL